MKIINFCMIADSEYGDEFHDWDWTCQDIWSASVLVYSNLDDDKANLKQ